MAIKIPLVLDADLKVQQLQTGDSIDVGADQVTATFTSTAIAGAPVYSDGNDTVDLGQANAAGTSLVVGLAKAPVTAAASGDYVHDGPLDLLTGEWDALCGTTGGLTAGLCYFLSDATAGRLLEQGSTAGITAGDTRVLCGRALSTTTMLVSISEPTLM